MLVKGVISFIITSPIFFYFNGTLQQWLTIGALLGGALILVGKVRDLAEERRMKQAINQTMPRMAIPGNQGNYQQPQVIFMPQQGIGAMQGQTQPPIPVWHDLPIERYELL